MEREVDLAPQHLVDWLRADRADGDGRLEVRATREFLGEDCPPTADGLDAEDGMEILTTVGVLEVAPARGHPRWVLRLRVEDPFGSHLPEDGSVPDGPEEISLDDFAAAFLPDGEAGAAATVTLETESPAAARGFERVLARILANRHG